MKIAHILLLLVPFIAQADTTIIDVERAQSHCPIILTVDDFGTTGTVIATPGYYMMCDDIEFTSGSVTAISIESSFVTIDMNTKSIFGTGLDIGITVTNTLHDIEIKKGKLSGKTKDAKSLLNKLRTKPKRVKGDIFEAKSRRSCKRSSCQLSTYWCSGRYFPLNVWA